MSFEISERTFTAGKIYKDRAGIEYGLCYGAYQFMGWSHYGFYLQDLRVNGVREGIERFWPINGIYNMEEIK